MVAEIATSSATHLLSSAEPPRLLFIPVSAPQGTGEYARAREIATAVAQRLPQAEIRFVLNKSAPYAGSVPFQTIWLPSSPTFHPQEVARFIHEFRPTLVIFDNAGRSAQLRAARAVGARVVFVSSRTRQRHKAFRLRWMRLIDEHWIAYPEFVAGSLSLTERLKLKMIKRPVVRFMDTVMPEIGPQESEAVLSRFGLKREGYALVVPGGGTGHPGAEDGPAIMAEAAVRLAAVQGLQVILVGGEASSRLSLAKVSHEPRLPMRELAALIRHARIVVTNGGDTLLQTLAFARPCVAAAIAGDQARRIKRCAAAGLVVGSTLDARQLERTALSLLKDEGRRSSQQAKLSRLRITNGINTAVDAIFELAAV
jgi:ADP-heptose:LPS heptosyltransferase